MARVPASESAVHPDRGIARLTQRFALPPGLHEAWLDSIARAGAATATSGHSSHRRFTCACGQIIPESKAPRLPVPFDASTLTA